jgi:hypothetical protein
LVGDGVTKSRSRTCGRSSIRKRCMWYQVHPWSWKHQNHIWAWSAATRLAGLLSEGVTMPRGIRLLDVNRESSRVCVMKGSRKVGRCWARSRCPTSLRTSVEPPY